MSEHSGRDSRSDRRRRGVVLLAAAASFAAGIALWVFALSQEPAERRQSSPVVTGAPTVDTPTAERRRPLARPAKDHKPDGRQPLRQAPRERVRTGHRFAFGSAVARVSVPTIGIDAPVIRLGLNRDRSLQVPGNASVAGWWSGGAKPGRSGTAVIVGHVDSRSGPAVFYRLRQLKKGDHVRVLFRDGTRADFSVTETRRYSKKAFPTQRVYARTGSAALRLITCGGSFDRSHGHYRDNLVVYARKA